MDFAQIWVILKGKMGSQGSWVKGPRAQALGGLGPDRAQARLLQSLLVTIGCMDQRRTLLTQ